MDNDPIIKAKIQGFYRSCSLLSYIGNRIHDEHFISLEQVRKQDRDACLAIQCPPSYNGLSLWATMAKN